MVCWHRLPVRNLRFCQEPFLNSFPSKFSLDTTFFCYFEDLFDRKCSLKELRRALCTKNEFKKCWFCCGCIHIYCMEVNRKRECMLRQLLLMLKVTRVGATSSSYPMSVYGIQKSALLVTTPIALLSLTLWISFFLLGYGILLFSLYSCMCTWQ